METTLSVVEKVMTSYIEVQVMTALMAAIIQTMATADQTLIGVLESSVTNCEV
jgi:hypothetical protein